MREQRYPFENMERFFDQMRREMFGGVTTPAIEGRQHGDAGSDDGIESRQFDGSWDAGITVEETDDGFVVLADLPGFDRDELSLRLHDDTLHLSGNHEVVGETNYRSRRVSERIALPTQVDPDHVTASYHNGVLEVRFTVAEEPTDGTEIDIE